MLYIGRLVTCGNAQQSSFSCTKMPTEACFDLTGKFYHGSYIYPIYRVSQGFWGTGETGHLFQGNIGQISRGTGEQRQYWGTGNIKKQIFDFWGTRKQANLFQGNKGTGTPPPWEGLNIRSWFYTRITF